MKRTFGTTLALVLVTLSPALAARVEVLGSGGTVFGVRTGTYGEMFPAQAQSENGPNPALALEILEPGKTAVRYLVPDTSGPESELTPFAVYDDSADTLYVVWQSQLKSVNSMLVVRSYHAGSWSEPIQVFGNIFSVKTSPRLVVTRDVFTKADGTTSVHRIVLHLTWWEDAGGGRAMYAPVVILDGQAAATSQVSYVLNDLDTAAGVADPNISMDLYGAPRALPGSDDASVVIGFVNPNNGHLSTVEATVLSADVEALADDVSIFVSQIDTSGTPSTVADSVRAHIINGGRFSSGVLNFFGEELRAHIINGGRQLLDDRLRLAADSYSILVGAGAELHGALRSADSKVPALAESLVGTGTQLLRLRTISSRVAPLTSNTGNQIFLSEDARTVLVAWDDPTGGIRYCESTADAWTQALQINAAVGADRALTYQLFLNRVRGH